MILAETGAVVALIDADDRHHEELREAWEADPAAWVLPWAILPKADSLLASQLGAAAEGAFLADVADGAFRVAWGDERDLAAARRIAQRHRSLKLGLVDAVVIAMAVSVPVPSVPVPGMKSCIVSSDTRLHDWHRRLGMMRGREAPMDTVVYSLVPPPGKASAAIWIPLVLMAVVFVVVGFFVVKSVVGAKTSTFTLSPAGLAIQGDLWGRTVPVTQLRGAEARMVDLAAEPALVPKRRTAGTGLPGYRSGWWRLANGEKALLYVTSFDRVVFVPTTDGYSILLSVSEPERFVEHLKRVAPAG